MSSQFNQPSPKLGTVGITPDTSEKSSIGKQLSKMSNLTKNLLSSRNSNTNLSGDNSSGLEHSNSDSTLPSHPPSYNASVTSSSNIPTNNTNSFTQSNASSSSFNHSGPFYRQSYSTPYADSMNYIPSGHNTPTVVGSSYSSHHSYTPTSFNGNHSTNNFISQSQLQQQQHQQPPQSQPQGFFLSSANSSGYKPNGVIPHSIPTTNVSMDSANSSNSFNNAAISSSSLHNVYHQQPGSHHQYHDGGHNSSVLQRIPHSFPNQNSGFNNSFQAPAPPSSQPQSNSNQNYNVSQTNASSASSSSFQGQSRPQFPQPSSYIPSEPDHYMTYKEFLHSLALKDAETVPSNTEINSDPNEPIYDEHLNIVDFPVNDLIMMLSCLLTKIIEANDKLYPNHFDNTIATRQKFKEEKKLRKLEKQKRKQEFLQQQENGSNMENSVELISDDNESDDNEEDEMKNKYLANVLAFHGTNVPGISLHAYLARVLKYCPVTNEVFLSLLVYFDRIAKKANNLKAKKNKPTEHDQDNKNDDESGESEQLFVMDSYNIHRLIISGITVSSKFFSDIFYKNLRYAKVGGLPLEELNYLELQFLLLLDFKLMITVEDLQNYADLLLKFWKREQLTNELVNGSQQQSEQSHHEQSQSQPQQS